MRYPADFAGCTHRLNRKRPRIVIADDCPAVLEHTRLLVGDDFDVVASAANGSELLKAVIECRPELVVTDIQMPGMSGLEAVREIRRSVPCKVVVLSLYDDPALIANAVAAGVRSYVLKQDAGEELVPALFEVQNGGTFF